MEFKFWGSVQSHLEELHSDACGSVITYADSLKSILCNALQISVNRALYRRINTKANNVATERTIEEWVNNFRAQPEAFDFRLSEWGLVFLLGISHRRFFYPCCDSFFSCNISTYEGRIGIYFFCSFHSLY
jgi:hypothetical protein